MAQRRRSLNAILLIALLSVCTLHAAEVEQPVRFRVISLFDAYSLLYDKDGTVKRVTANTSIPSPWQEAPKNRTLDFFRVVPAEEEGLSPRRESLVDVKLPSGPGPYLIIFSKQANGELSTLVVDHSLDVHKPMNYRTFNFSKRRMAIRLAEKDMLLDSGKSEFTPYPDENKAWLKIAVDQPDSGWIKVISKPKPVDSTTRTTFIILDIPPSRADPNPIGIVVREIKEEIIETDLGPMIR